MQPFRFLDLPKELRLMVYGRLPTSSTFEVLDLSTPNDPQHHVILQHLKFPVDILGTCKLVKAESEPFLDTAIGASALQVTHSFTLCVFGVEFLSTFLKVIDFHTRLTERISADQKKVQLSYYNTDNADTPEEELREYVYDRGCVSRDHAEKVARHSEYVARWIRKSDHCLSFQVHQSSGPQHYLTHMYIRSEAGPEIRAVEGNVEVHLLSELPTEAQALIAQSVSRQAGL